MAIRITIGLQLLIDPDAARADLLEMIEETDGNVSRMAWQYDLSRRHLYRILTRANLWTEVDRARDANRNADAEWHEQARLALVGGGT